VPGPVKERELISAKPVGFQYIKVGGTVTALIMLVHEGHAQAMRFFTPTNADSYDLVLRLARQKRDRY
jgi:hypothetical protein